jgi:tripartite-type tricarboxylate transporter receptor subunit TctC
MMRCSSFYAMHIALVLVPGVAAFAQDTYPSKPVRLVVPAVGGGSDLVARIIAPRVSEVLGQQLVVDNRGAIAPEIVAKAPPDGYTLHVNGSPLWLLPLLRPAAWDPLRDFVAIAMPVTSPSILAVHPSLPVKNARELIALAKARPGQLNYAAGTIGAAPHLAAELFKSMTGTDIVRVPYKGSGPALIGLMTGEAQIMFPGASGTTYVKQGKIRALAVGSLEPSPLLPGIPTIAASGVPGFESVSPQGVFAPAKTPPAIVAKLQQEIARALNAPEVKERAFASGNQVVANSPDAFGAWLRTDIDRAAKLIRKQGIKEE